MLLTGPTYTVANRLVKNEFLVELDLRQNIFNEEPACLDGVEFLLSYDYLWLLMF